MNNLVRTLALISVFCGMVSACSLAPRDDADVILDMYAETMRAFSNEDLHGIMKNISKDFHSNVNDQRDYEELRENRKRFILNNSNVAIGFRNINIKTEKSRATVQYTVVIKTDQIEMKWAQTDTLRKSWGKWKVVSWYIEGNM